MNQKRKQVVAKSIEPNAGRRLAYSRKLDKLFKKFRQEVYNGLITELSNSPILAYDDSLSNPRTVIGRNRLKELKAKVDSLIRRNPQKLRELINEIVANKMVDWLSGAERDAFEVVKWYVKNCAYEVSASMRRSLISAGISPLIFKERWKLPTVNQYISPNALARIPDLIREQTALITRMNAQDLAEVRQVVMDCLTQGRDFADIENILFASEGFNAKRAKRVALDQSCKVSQAVQIANALSLGINKGIWIHVPGQYTSRETHIEMNGKEFDLRTGLFDRKVGYKVLPADLPYCRCIWRSVIPENYLGLG